MQMQTKNLIPLFFCLSILIFLNSNNVNAQTTTPTLMATYTNDYMGAFNPAELYVYDTSLGKNKLITVYGNITGATTKTLTVKVYDLNTSTLLFTATQTLAAYSLCANGIAVYPHQTTTTHDGFYVVVGYYGDSETPPTILRAKVFYCNYTTESLTDIGNVGISTTGTSYDASLKVIFSNIVYVGGNHYVAVTFPKAYYLSGSGYRRFTIMLQFTPTTCTGKGLVFDASKGYGNIGFQRISGSDLNPDYIIFYGHFWSNDLSHVYSQFAYYRISLTTMYESTTETDVIINYQPRYYDLTSLMKYKGLQHGLASGTVEFYTAYWTLTDNTALQTKMVLEKITVNMVTLALSGRSIETAYYVTGVVYNADLRDPTTTIAKNYYYSSAATSIFSVAYDSATGNTATQTVNLGLTPNSNTYILGQYAFFMHNATHIKLYSTGKIPEAEVISPPPPLPPAQDTTFNDVAITVLVQNLALPILFILLPTFLLGSMLGMGGVIVGLSLGIGLSALAGLIPFWLVVLIALGIIAFIFRGKTHDAE